MFPRRGSPARARLRPYRRRIQGFRRPAKAFASIIPTPGKPISTLFSVNSESVIGKPETSVADSIVYADPASLVNVSEFGSMSIGLEVQLSSLDPSDDVQFGSIEVEIGLPPALESTLGSVVNSSAFGNLSLFGEDGAQPAGAQWHEATAMIVRSMFYADDYGVPVAWENNSMCIEPQPNLWIRFSVATSEDEVQATIGPSAHYRFAGVATAQIFGRLHQGDRDVRNMADRICDKFRGRAEPGIYFRAPSQLFLGRDGMWYRANVSLPFVAERFIRATA